MALKYGARRHASEDVRRFSIDVLGEGFGNDVDGFARRDGYHCLVRDRAAVSRSFAESAPPLMDRLLQGLADLTGELAEAVVENDGPYIAAVGELSWLIAQAEYCYAACQLSARRKSYVLAQPVLTCFRNLDTRPLSLCALRLDEPFESLSRLPLERAEVRILAPGESFLLDGFRELIWFEESGVLLGSVSTLPLGAYEATFDAVTGERIGLFSTEMRLSSIEVVLRTLAAAGDACAVDIAAKAARFPMRELRWAALNYLWRCDPPDLPERLVEFSRDPDPEIAAIALQCLAQIESVVAA